MRWACVASAFTVIASAQEPRQGALFACGGGTLPDSVRNAFAARAGGREGRVVVIPTASATADRSRDAEAWLAPWRAFGFASLEVLHAQSREEADKASFPASLDTATAVWLGGGDQSRLIERYAGTRTARAFEALLHRGGVIGGTSAGCAAMTTPMIAGGKTEPRLAQGFDWLPGAIFDQHFVARQREPRLTRALELSPGHLGVGIDEGTALWIEGREARVLGASLVVLRLAAGAGRDALRSEWRADSRFDWIAWVRAARARCTRVASTTPRGLIVAMDASAIRDATAAFAAAIQRSDPQRAGLCLIGANPDRLLECFDDPSGKHPVQLWSRTGQPMLVLGRSAEALFGERTTTFASEVQHTPSEGYARGMGWLTPADGVASAKWFRADHRLWIRGDPDLPRTRGPDVAQRPAAIAHAHNDYVRPRPLMDALEAGVGSLEVDVFALDGALRVGHTRLEAAVGPRLEELYLEPLAKRVSQGHGRIYADGRPLHLLIDFKNDGAVTLELLAAALAPHRAWLTRFHPEGIDGGAVTIVISGSVPRAHITMNQERWWAIDGRVSDLGEGSSPALIPWISAAWSSIFRARKSADWNADDARILRRLVTQAHAEGRRIRFWATPADPGLWLHQIEAGVDWINVDDPAALRDFRAAKGTLKSTR